MVKITSIDDYLDSLSAEHREITKSLISIIEETVPGAKQQISWSTPHYKLNDKWFVVLMNAKTHVSLGFVRGIYLDSDLLVGTGKQMRHIEIKDMEDLKSKEKEIKHLLKSALALEV